jgi:hypothetical protein
MFWQSLQGKQMESFSWGFQVRGIYFIMFILFILVLNIIKFGFYFKLGLFWPIRHCFKVCFSIRLVLVDY